MAEEREVNWADVYRQRRNRIREAVGGGAILWLGHVLQGRNYAANPYPFRQNSNFLYFVGLDEPDLAVLSYPEKDNDVLFSMPTTIDDIVWSGGAPSRIDLARQAGIDTVEDISRLGVYLTQASMTQGLKVHYAPPFQATTLFRIAELLVIDPAEAPAGASKELIQAAAQQRSIKSDIEIAEIEDALEVTGRMHRACMAAAQPGAHERELAGMIQGIALSSGRQQSYSPIVTVRGEILHNNFYVNRLERGQLLLNDSGAESPRYYASDITRTCPVGGRFSSEQAEVYETVLRAQLAAIEAIRPGLTYREIHLLAAKILVEGLTSIGVMTGNAEDAAAAGAHALFFPHGLGHMLGLDVHDMEDLGDVVGYARGEKRSSQFGLNFLRLARSLEPGYVLTVEPGIYFIPALMDRWEQEKQHPDFIDYDRLRRFRNFGGIRIEDDVLVTETGARVLGPGIPKSIPEVEAAMRA
jgi:Xaa-Pro aminopeptidase